MTKAENGELIDMVAIARENALADAMLTRPGMRKVIAPAKVNLFLGIGDKLDTGYHEVTNVMHAVMLHDTVYVRSVPAKAGSGLSITVVCTGKDGVEPPDVDPERNIAYRAAAAFAEELGRTEDETIEIVIEKRIPHEAGLGGGSSDAAATIAGLCDVWGVGVDDPAAVAAARSVGSDVPFFLHGGCALFDGAGEVFANALEPRRESIVIVKPDAGLSTAEVYAEFDKEPSPIPEVVHASVRAAASAHDVPLMNSLAAPAERLMPELAAVRSWLEGVEGAGEALLCGSGSSTFAVCDDFATACAVAAKAQARGWWARATTFSSARASVIPDKR